MLQLDTPLVTALHDRGFRIAIETNGTLAVPDTLDWICVSPKADSSLVQTRGHELKLVYPQAENSPEQFAELEFDHFFLQPRDDAHHEANVRATIAYCLANPQWRLSTQTHKVHGID